MDSPKYIGDTAEAYVVKWLISEGYKIIDTNWRTKYCEIDVIAKKDGIVLFIEVRYRKQQIWGSGVESITPKKLRQMQFAADAWMSKHNYIDNASICAAGVSGDPMRLDDFIEITTN